ncbi:MAG: hypothetical protein HEQ38_10055 [Gemmatimonas sp.]|jgi:hypothetical protein|uniref:hypothetical protein n=1 Tax=Gemmatimonas sp. TaxID=1962908 RepID=UPI0031CB82A8|nr:hypothetical protein [Gemmatimonas sp.]
MRTPPSRYCWSNDQCAVWIVDIHDGDLRYFTFSAKIGEWQVNLTAEVRHYAYRIQGIDGTTEQGTDPFRNGQRRRGLGTLVGNAALAYARHLNDPDIETARGRLSTESDHLFGADVKEVATARKAFAERFGIHVPLNEWFTVPLASLTPRRAVHADGPSHALCPVQRVSRMHTR